MPLVVDRLEQFLGKIAHACFGLVPGIDRRKALRPLYEALAAAFADLHPVA